MKNIILDTYLSSITNDDFLVEGLTPSSIKDAVSDIKNKDPKLFLKKYKGKVKEIEPSKIESEVEKVAEKHGIKKENVTTSKVMLKRALGTIFVGVPATVILPISLACLIACIIRTLVNKQSLAHNTLAMIKEIKSGMKTTRRTNITNMEKAVITAGQTSDYLWGAFSDKPLVVIKNAVAFIGMYLASIFYFYKGIVFAGEQIKD